MKTTDTLHPSEGCAQDSTYLRKLADCWADALSERGVQLSTDRIVTLLEKVYVTPTDSQCHAELFLSSLRREERSRHALALHKIADAYETDKIDLQLRHENDRRHYNECRQQIYDRYRPKLDEPECDKEVTLQVRAEWLQTNEEYLRMQTERYRINVHQAHERRAQSMQAEEERYNAALSELATMRDALAIMVALHYELPLSDEEEDTPDDLASQVLAVEERINN